MNNPFPHRPAVYSVQLEVKPVLPLRVSGCFVVTGGNLMSALPLSLQHRNGSVKLIYSLISLKTKASLTWE
jgi:hypothetical protein